MEKILEVVTVTVTVTHTSTSNTNANVVPMSTTDTNLYKPTPSTTRSLHTLTLHATTYLRRRRHLAT